MLVFKPNDPVAMTCEGNTIAGTVLAASENGHSLALRFDGIVAGYAGIIAVTRDSTGLYRTLHNTPVIVRHRVEPYATLNRLEPTQSRQGA
jgi:hypothetical protein